MADRYDTSRADAGKERRVDMSGPNGGAERGGRFRGVGPKNYTRSDDRVKEDVCERLMQDPDVDASEIEVEFQDGQVILNGTVDDRNAKWLAEDIAESVPGVTNVVNKLKASSLEKALRR